MLFLTVLLTGYFAVQGVKSEGKRATREARDALGSTLEWASGAAEGSVAGR